MKISTMILGIIFFAAATIIVYGWGLVRQKNQSGDLMRLLFGKGEEKIIKYLKQEEYITNADVEKLCGGLEARLPFSSGKAVVKDEKNFADQLLAYMVKTGQLEKEGSRYIKRKNK